MRRKASRFVYVVAFAGLFLPPVMLAALLPYFINTEPVRARLLAELDSWTGGEVKMAGAVSVDSIFSISVEVRDVEIGKFKQLPAITGIRAGKIVARISSLDILAGNLDFDKIKIYDAIIEVEAEGARETADSLLAMLSGPHENPFAAFAINNTIVAVRGGPDKPFKHLRFENASVSFDKAKSQMSASGSVLWANERVRFYAQRRIARGRQEARMPLNVEIDSDVLRGQFEGETNFAGAWEAVGYVGARTPDLARLLAWLGVSSSSVMTGGAEIKGKVDLAGGQLSLRSADFAMGGHSASGSLTFTPGAARPHVEGSLAFPRINFDVLAGMDWQDKGPLLASRADADLRISADTLIWRGMKTGAAAFTLGSKGGSLSAEVAELVFLEGSVSGHAALDMNRKPARATVRLSAESVNAATFLELLQQKDWLSGQANAHVEADAEWGQSGLVLDTANARARISFPEGGQMRLDIPRLADAAATATLEGWDRLNFTAASFDDLRFDATLERGQLHCSNMMLSNANSVVKGMGQVDLTGRSLDLRLTVAPGPEVTGAIPLIQSSSPPATRSVLSIQGSWNRPVIRTEASSAVTNGTISKSAAALEVTLSGR